MPCLQCLYENPSLRKDPDAVDIVAVHGAGGHWENTWIDEETQNLWLRDFIPSRIPTARILSFGYSLPHGKDDPVAPFAELSGIRTVAATLVSQLYGDRYYWYQRPIIFICHGLGGTIVKEALIWASTQASYKEDKAKLHSSIIISTYAILFLSTPYEAVDKSTWLALKQAPLVRAGSRDWLQKLAKRIKDNDQKLEEESATASKTLRTIAENFSSFIPKLKLCFFADGTEMDFNGKSRLVVPWSLACPPLPNIETHILSVNFLQMANFVSESSPGYRAVLSVLERYSRASAHTIKTRWTTEDVINEASKHQEIHELGGGNTFLPRVQKPVYVGEEWNTVLPITVNPGSAPQQKAKVPRCKFFFPPDADHSDFLGRTTECNRICQAFFDHPAYSQTAPTQQRFVIHGIGGSGKTRLCRQFAADKRESYAAIFTVMGESRRTASESYAQIASRTGRPAAAPELTPIAATEAQGREWLATQTEPWLLIIDNVDDPSINMDELLPRGDYGHVLITTRNAKLVKYQNVGFLELRGLPEDDAVQLLLDRAGLVAWDLKTREKGMKIVRALGCLARAIVQAGASILCQGIKLDEYLSHWKKYWRRRVQKAAGSPQEEDKIFTSFDISLQYLNEDNTPASADALEMLRIISFYHFENIGREIFLRAMRNRRNAIVDGNGPGDAIPSLLAQKAANRARPPPALPQFIRQDGDGTDELRIHDAVQKLRSVSFISLNGSNHTFSMHPLLREWVRNGLDNRMKWYWGTISMTVLAESVMLPPADTGMKHAEFRRRILPHLDACLADPSFKGNLINIPDFKGWWDKLKLYSSFVLAPTSMFILGDKATAAAKCGYIYASCGRFDDAARYLRPVKNILMLIYGNRHERTVSAMVGLSAVLWGFGHLAQLDEAIELQQEVVSSRKAVYGLSHIETFRAMTMLSRSYWLRGFHHEAMELQEATVARMESIVPGPKEESSLLEALDLYGVILGSFRQFQKSVDVHQKVLDMRMERFGLLHHDTSPYVSQTHSRPPSTHSTATESITHEMQPRDIDMNQILDQLGTKQNLAMAQLDLWLSSGPANDTTLLDQAQRNMREVLDRRKRLLGEEHPWTLWALCSLAKVLIETGSLGEAEQMLDKGIPAAEKALRPGHPGVLMGWGELAKVYARQGKYEEAEEMGAKILRSLEKARGKDHPDTVYAAWRLSNLYERQGKMRKAVELCEDALRKGSIRLTAKGRQYPLCSEIEEHLTELRRLLSSSSGGSQDRADTSGEVDGRRKSFKLLSRRTFTRGGLTW